MRIRRASDLSSIDRDAFSLVELLVSVAIIGALLAVALPAVQMSRESARKTQCQSQLRQIGTAIQNHYSQFGRLPEDGLNGYGFAVPLLPHLDQASLYERIRPNVKSQQETDNSATNTVLEIFVCPSFSGENPVPSTGRGRSTDLGNSELLGQPMDLTDVIDGESNTIAVGETVRDHTWATPGTGTCESPPNSGSFGSMHSGGAYFLLCDGAVRFITDAVDAATFRALGTPAGGEAVGEF